MNAASIEDIMDAAVMRAARENVHARPKVSDPPEAEKPPERIGQRDKLLAVAAGAATIWTDADGDAYATVQSNGHVEHWPVRSRGFKQWLLAAYAFDPASRREIGGRNVPGAVSKQALEDALANLEAWVRSAEAKVHPAELRSVMHQGRLYLDIGCESWRAIEVSSEGWRIVTDHRCRSCAAARPTPCLCPPSAATWPSFGSSCRWPRPTGRCSPCG